MPTRAPITKLHKKADNQTRLSGNTLKFLLFSLILYDLHIEIQTLNPLWKSSSIAVTALKLHAS